MADRDYAPDEWSDHDFFVITPPGGQEELRNDLSWLPCRRSHRALGTETDHGLIVIYDDGHLLEFAVFDLEEIALAGVNRYRVLLDRGGVEERVEHVAVTPRPQRDDLFLFGKTLIGRARRDRTGASRRDVQCRIPAHLGDDVPEPAPDPDRPCSRTRRSSTASTRSAASSARIPSSEPSSLRSCGSIRPTAAPRSSRARARATAVRPDLPWPAVGRRPRPVVGGVGRG